MLDYLKLMGPWATLRNGLRVVRRDLGRWPREITVEASAVCNLACPFCVTRDIKVEAHREARFLSLELFRKLVDEVGGFCPRINFSCYGEPLMNPALPDMIRYAADRKIFTSLFTNTTLLDAENGQRLLDAGLTRIFASFESFDRDVYEATKVGARFDETEANLRALVRARRERGAVRPQIVLRVVVTRKTAPELDSYRARARELGVDAVAPKALTVWPQGDAAYQDEMLTSYAVEHEISRYDRAREGTFVPRARRVPCPCIRTPAVLCDGRVTLCWFDVLGEGVVGSLADESFPTIWKRAATFRERTLASGHAFSICSRCPGIGEEPPIIALRRAAQGSP